MINYPTPKKRPAERKVSVKNRGMRLEKLIDEANQYYLEHDVAVIHKKPTPLQVVGVSYPSRNKAKITEAYYRTPSTTDYNGIYKGAHIDFDVKENRTPSSFPLKNIQDHQIKHLKRVHKHGGVAFLLIHWHSDETVYLLGYEWLKHYLKRSETGRKSIRHDEIQSVGFAVKEGFAPRIDYLKAVDAYMEKDSSK